MKKLLIEHTENQTRTAITENGKLTEIYIDKKDASLVGNVIVGRIKTIMPGQFAFIDIGSNKNAFANFNVSNNYKAGHPLLVQVQKDATSSKGAYVSTDISLKGWLVILHKQPPGEVGVSHKITDEKESRRLKTLVRSILPKGYGAIVRTNAQSCAQDALEEEINKLHQAYEEILQRAQYALPPVKLYPHIEIPSILADIVSEDLDEIHISGSAEVFATASEYITGLVPSLAGRILNHEKVFDQNNIPKQIRNALEKVVNLTCGGFITIEETEACVVIDVNTGNNTGSQSYRQTVLNTNLEAAVVIVDQIILRNLSGIIIIDFIDMSRQEDKAALMAAFMQEAKRDRLNPEILNISQLGIVQMARPKRRLSLSKILEINCPHCGGHGKVRN